MDNEQQDEFSLHFSAYWRAGADLPKVQDVILLFQTTEMPGYRDTFLTHLVTPVYENAEDTNDPVFQEPDKLR